MNKKSFLLILVLCVVLSCSIVLTACGSAKSEPPQFYDKTFVLEKLSVDYDSEIDGTALSTLLENNLQHIDWKHTISANASTIDSATFTEEVTTLARAKEIIATLGKNVFGMKMVFASKDAKTATMTYGTQNVVYTVIDDDDQGVNAALKSDKGKEIGRISLNYNDETNEIEYLHFTPDEVIDFTIYLKEEMELLGSTRSSFTIVSQFYFMPQA